MYSLQIWEILGRLLNLVMSCLGAAHSLPKAHLISEKTATILRLGKKPNPMLNRKHSS
jgi:hypothetical protein